MHLCSVVTAFVTLLPTVIEGHGGGLPQLLVPRSVKELRARNLMGARNDVHHAAPGGLKKRQAGGVDGECGPGVGSCSAGYCCSSAGYCGSTKEYCAAPDCQLNYGTGCDTLKMPSGPTTNDVARTKVGSVLYGSTGIYQCTKPGTVALTYDDGPYSYTSDLLDLFASYSAKATFFITGNNNGKGMIDNASLAWPAILRRMYAAGHQLASHTWGHQDLSAITKAQRMDQMRFAEMAFNNVLGFFPTYMRPPYSSCTTACAADMATLGYHIVYFDLDTEDYLHDDPNEIQISKNDFSGNLSTRAPATGDFLTVAHDIHYQTVYNLTQFMLDAIVKNGWKAVTVGECLGDPVANWYRTGPNANSTSSIASTSSSPKITSSSSAKITSSSSAKITSSSVKASSSSVKTSSSSAKLTSSSTKVTSSSGLSKSSSVSPASSSSAPAASALPVSTDATCGANSKNTCLGSSFGNCCSVNGWCGTTDAYCGSGCQSGYGNCGSNSASASSVASSTSSSTSSQPAASSSAAALVISPDASCGGTTGYTCTGSAYGNCCSQFGWCGSTSDYCTTSCNPSFGTCTTT